MTPKFKDGDLVRFTEVAAKDTSFHSDLEADLLADRVGGDEIEKILTAICERQPVRVSSYDGPVLTEDGEKEPGYTLKLGETDLGASFEESIIEAADQGSSDMCTCGHRRYAHTDSIGPCQSSDRCNCNSFEKKVEPDYAKNPYNVYLLNKLNNPYLSAQIVSFGEQAWDAAIDTVMAVIARTPDKEIPKAVQALKSMNQRSVKS